MNETKGSAAQEPGLLERIGDILGESGLHGRMNDEERVTFLTKLQAVTQGEEKKVAKERGKLVFQVKLLRTVFLLMVALFCTLWWRISRVEETALAKAYVINVEKLEVGARAISKALDVVLGEVAKWVKDASEDEQTTPQDRAIRLGNLERLGETVRQNKGQFDAIAARCQVALKEAPPKIDANTVLTDPFTGVAIPLNATKGGRLDESVVAQVLGNEKILMAYLVLGKQFGGRGAVPMPDNLGDASKAIQVDSEALGAVGLKVRPPEASRKN